MKQINLISIQELDSLYNEIMLKKSFFEEEFQIVNTKSKEISFSGYDFVQHNTVLPTFSYYEEPRGLAIEIAIQKQQYASGIQPMVYFNIPISQFDNCTNLLGNTSKSISTAVLTINKQNKHFIINQFKYFGICSFRHKVDALEIIELIKNNNFIIEI